MVKNIFVQGDILPRRQIYMGNGHRGIKGKMLFLKFQRFKESNFCFNIKPHEVL